MAQLVERDPRVLNVGLCNFDTKRMNEILNSGVKIVSNQVQVPLSPQLFRALTLTHISSLSSIFDQRSKWPTVAFTTTSNYSHMARL